MGGNVSREVAITEEKSGTMSNSFSWSGTFPRGMSLEGNLSTKLTKFKKFEVTPKKKSPENKDTVLEEEEDGHETSDKEFIESLLINVLEDALDGVTAKKGMTKSSTLPANMKGLGVTRTQSFGKRIRKSIRKLVVKTPKKNKKEDCHGSSEDIVEALLVEVLGDVTGCQDESIEELEQAELTETVIEIEENILEEDELLEEAIDGISELNTSKNTSKSSTLPANFKGLGSNVGQSFGKRIRKSIRKFVTPKKNKIVGKKESIELVDTIIGDILDNVVGIEQNEEEIEKPIQIQELVNETKDLEIVEDTAVESTIEDSKEKENTGEIVTATTVT